MRKDDHLINESISQASLKTLYSKLQSDFENAAGILDSLRRIHKIPEKYWVSILKGYKAWENKSMGENAEWDKMEMEKEDVEFIKNNNIPWKWMYEENAEGQSVGSGIQNQNPSGKKFLMINWDEQTLKVVPEAFLEKWLNIRKKEAMQSFTTETEEEKKSSLDQIGFELNSIQGRIREYFVGEGGPSFVNLN